MILFSLPLVLSIPSSKLTQYETVRVVNSAGNKPLISTLTAPDGVQQEGNIFMSKGNYMYIFIYICTHTVSLKKQSSSTQVLSTRTKDLPILL